jgi:hypothetical protein
MCPAALSLHHSSPTEEGTPCAQQLSISTTPLRLRRARHVPSSSPLHHSSPTEEGTPCAQQLSLSTTPLPASEPAFT